MPRTLTPAPTDRAMWRKLLRRAHPDAGGDHELFIWTEALREHVVSGASTRRHPRPSEAPPTYADTADRVDFAVAFGSFESFADLTRAAVKYADEVGEPYAALLKLLADCEEAGEYDGGLYRQQHTGATYKTLAAIAHKAGMSRQERSGWYRVAESIPLSQRHAGHIMSRLQQNAA